MPNGAHDGSRLTIGAAQTVPVRGDVAANLAVHRQWTQRAAREGVRLLVFPELSLTGYEPDLAPSLAFEPEDRRLVPLLDDARRHEITLVVGAPLRLASGLHIGSFLIGPDRAIEPYTKRYLHTSEEAVFRSFDLNPLVALGDDKGAIAICADANDPRHAREAADLGASLYLVSAFLSSEGYGADLERLRGHAKRYGFAVLLSNYAGRSGGLAAAGGSSFLAPGGKLLARLPATGTGIVVAVRERDGWSARSIPA